MAQILIKNCTLINRGKKVEGASILIEGNRIGHIYHNEEELPHVEKTLDATGLICIPGVIDDQVHFRDPGLTHKGDIYTESRAALLGGVTSFMDMPNTKPQTTTPEDWVNKMAIGAEKAWTNYAFYFGATNDNTHFIKEMSKNEHVPGVKVFMGASTGNMLVDNERSLQSIFQETNGIVATHCESEEIIRKNKGKYIDMYGEDPDVKYHPDIRSREACIASSTKAINLAKESNANLHILHLSTAEEVELIKNAPTHITAEVCVHHLWFDKSDYDRLGTKIKWNPAIKETSDRDALREAVRDGVISIVATDHAPHLAEEKEGGALKAASGGPLIQYSLLMMLELVREDILSIERVVDVMCHTPADRFKVINRGYLDVGCFADITLIDPNKSWTVEKDNIASKCGWSPLEGQTFHNCVQHVFVNGVLSLEDGRIVEESKGCAMPLTFSKDQ